MEEEWWILSSQYLILNKVFVFDLLLVKSGWLYSKYVIHLGLLNKKWGLPRRVIFCLNWFANVTLVLRGGALHCKQEMSWQTLYENTLHLPYRGSSTFPVCRAATCTQHLSLKDQRLYVI